MNSRKLKSVQFKIKLKIILILLGIIIMRFQVTGFLN